MEEKICKECGGILRYDRDKKMFECAYCGRVTAANEDNLDISLESVETLIGKGRFSMAESMIKDLLKTDPDNPRLIYNKILCYYQDKSVAAILIKYRKNTKKLKAIKAMTEWRTLTDLLPEDKRVLVACLGRYIDTALELCEVKTDVGDSVNRSGKSAAGIQSGGPKSQFWSDIFSLYLLSSKEESIFRSDDVYYDDKYLSNDRSAQKKRSSEARGKRDSLEKKLDLMIIKIKEVESNLWSARVIPEEDLDDLGKEDTIDSKTCPKCASPLRYDRTNKYLMCSYCEWKEPYDHVEREASIEEIDRLLNERSFAKAKPIILEMLDRTPFDPNIQLRYIYCVCHATDMRNLLETNKDKPERIQQILKYPEWEIIESHLPEHKRDLVALISLYYEISSDLADNLLALNNAREASGVAKQDKKPSTFAKMDAEYAKEMERQGLREQVEDSTARSEIGAFFHMIGEDLNPFSYEKEMQSTIEAYSPEFERKCAEERAREKEEVVKAKRDIKSLPQKRLLLSRQQDEILKQILDRLEYLSE